MAAKRAYHHGNLREALVAAALKEVARSGPEAFSLREVARRAGVSPPAVYRHFADKDALLAAVAAECAERIGAVMQAALAEAPDDPLERFRASGIAYVQFAVAHPEHFRAMAMPGVAECEPDLQQFKYDAAERASIQRAQAEGTIAKIPIDALMLAASSLVHGLAQKIVEGKLGDVDAARAKQLAIEITAVLGAGLAPRKEPYVDALSGMRFEGQRR